MRCSFADVSFFRMGLHMHHGSWYMVHGIHGISKFYVACEFTQLKCKSYGLLDGFVEKEFVKPQMGKFCSPTIWPYCHALVGFGWMNGRNV